MARALVVFHGTGSHWASPLLKRGFQHVFVAVADEDSRAWIVIDPKHGVPEFRAWNLDYDLAEFYRNEGCKVVATETSASPRAGGGPWMLANCVGAAKMILGIRAPLLFSPHALYRRLTT